MACALYNGMLKVIFNYVVERERQGRRAFVRLTYTCFNNKMIVPSLTMISLLNILDCSHINGGGVEGKRG